MIYLENLYRQCLAEGFLPLNENSSEAAPLTAAITMAKEENTNLCLLQIAQPSKMDESIYRFLREQELSRAVAMTPSYSSVWVVFLTLGEEGDAEPDFESAEGYFGQSPYAVYWHVKPATGEFLVPSSQPDDVMGLKAAVIGAFGTAEAEPEPQHEVPALPAHAPAICTFVIATANIIIMLMMHMAGYATAPLVVAARFGAIVPHLIWGAGEYYRLLTAIFVHFGWTHLFFNVAGMLIFGTRIERYYGKAQFLAIYFISGLCASVASLLLTQGFSAGASGAVYGLLGAAFVYTRYTKKPLDVINNQTLLIYIIMGLGMSFIMPNIDYFGHIGGLLSGALIGYIILRHLGIRQP